MRALPVNRGEVDRLGARPHLLGHLLDRNVEDERRRLTVNVSAGAERLDEGGIIRKMREQGVRIIVREPHESQRNAEFLREKTGAGVAVLAGSVGALPAARDYLALFDADIEALIAAGAGQ